MRKTITTKNHETGESERISFDSVKKCPLCHASFNGETMSSALAPFETENRRIYGLYVLHYCQVCGIGFYALYEPKSDPYSSSYSRDTIYKLVGAMPRKPESKDFIAEIGILSPSFVRIYEEANRAESYGLTSICGMAYRKALEYLVKDYLLEKHPNEATKITAETLSQSIRRIDSPKIRTLAERAAWLGNDETHYLKRHVDYSYLDIKDFLEAMVAFIQYEKTVDKAAAIPRI